MEDVGIWTDRKGAAWRYLPCGKAQLLRIAMLSLQDSVFFEISIKSLLKSWSSSCEYLTKLPVMFTYHTGPPVLSATRSQWSLCSKTVFVCSPVCPKVSNFLPVEEKWILMELSGWAMPSGPGFSRALLDVNAVCRWSVSSAYHPTGSLLSVDSPTIDEQTLIMNTMWI